MVIWDDGVMWDGDVGWWCQSSAGLARSKQGHTKNKAKQHNTSKAVIFPK